MNNDIENGDSPSPKKRRYDESKWKEVRVRVSHETHERLRVGAAKVDLRFADFVRHKLDADDGDLLASKITNLLTELKFYNDDTEELHDALKRAVDLIAADDARREKWAPITEFFAGVVNRINVTRKDIKAYYGGFNGK